MRKNICFAMTAIFMMVFCGCSNDEVNDLAGDKVDDFSFATEELSGTWELEHCYNPAAYGGDFGQFSINKDESIVEFKDGKTINVKGNSSTYFDEYFLPSGQYSCTINSKDNLPEEVLAITVVKTEKEIPGRMPYHWCEFQKEGNKLVLNVYTAHESYYPMLQITYTFHQKK